MASKRDNNGRFIKGHSGNPGGRQRITDLPEKMETIMHRLTQEEWDRIVDVGISRAQAGDVGWARFLANYRWGKPIERRIVEQSQDVVLEWVKREDNGPASA